MIRRRDAGKESQPQNIVRVRMLEVFGEEGATARRVYWQKPDPEALIPEEGELVEVEDREITVWPSELPTTVGNGDDDEDDGELTVVAYMADTKRWELLSMGGTLIGKSDSEIPAKTGNTAGSGRVNIWRFKNDGTDDMEATGRWVTAKNLGTGPVSPDIFLQLSPHFQGSRWLISYEDCEAAS